MSLAWLVVCAVRSLYLFHFLYTSLLRHLDSAGFGGMPSDVSPDEVHSSVLKSAKALHINADDR